MNMNNLRKSKQNKTQDRTQISHNTVNTGWKGEVSTDDLKWLIE